MKRWMDDRIKVICDTKQGKEGGTGRKQRIKKKKNKTKGLLGKYMCCD